ncbi:MAG: chorismate synthase [Candidatus Omnitrophica bacterium]|nr:chorismate synthase [Candidatus Omnitrophota bacterium]MDD5574372.1 chorismate synthase [Candidatus Omnitrophota bacterium]
MLRFLTAGESHGRCMVAVLEGMPAGLKLDLKEMNMELKRRQLGYGRGDRMKIEGDNAEILSGVKNGQTLGSPIGLYIKNNDFRIDELIALTNPRPGHADLVGCLKYGHKDIRNVLERASARETVCRVAVGAVCKQFLREFDVSVASDVVMIGGETNKDHMKKKIDAARKNLDTLGGMFVVRAVGLPPGLGSYVAADRRLNARLAGAVMSIPAIKAVEFGLGVEYARAVGSKVHDAIYYAKEKGYYRRSNNAGGIEGGMSNGEPVVLRCTMKPIATVGKPLDSVDIVTKKAVRAAVERYDICAVEAAGVVAESVTAFVLAEAMLEKFGGDSLSETKRNHKAYIRSL